MNDTTFSIVVILGFYLAALYAVCLANYAAGTLTHDEDQDALPPRVEDGSVTFVRIR